MHLFPQIAEMTHWVISGGAEGGSINHAARSRRAGSKAQSKLTEANLFVSAADAAASVSFMGRGERWPFPRTSCSYNRLLFVSPQRPLRRTAKTPRPPALQTRRQTPPRCCSTVGVTTWDPRVGVLRSRSSVTMVTIATLVTGSPSPGPFQICDQTGRS